MIVAHKPKAYIVPNKNILLAYHYVVAFCLPRELYKAQVYIKISRDTS